MSGKQIIHAVQAFNAGLHRKTRHTVLTAVQIAEMEAALDDIRGEQVAESEERQRFLEDMEDRRRWN